MDYILIIAAIASVIGAVFAAWRWDYARKAFTYQKRQLYLQILMLAESREYWRMKKMDYVKKYMNSDLTVLGNAEQIINELENAIPE